MSKALLRFVALSSSLVVIAGICSAQIQTIRTETVSGTTRMSIGSRPSFHATQARVADLRQIAVESGPGFVASWREISRSGATEYSAISLDGENVAKLDRTDRRLHTMAGTFDPASEAAPVPGDLSVASSELCFLQLWSQPFDSIQAMLQRQGVEIAGYYPEDALLVRIPAERQAEVRAMPIVRALLPVHPGFKAAPSLLSQLLAGSLEAQEYNLVCVRPGPVEKSGVAAAAELLGGRITQMIPDGTIVQVWMSPSTLLRLLSHPGVVFVEPTPQPSDDMDIVRTVSGSNLFESTLGMTGQGVRAEVMDGGVRTTHVAFLPRGVLMHTGSSGDTSHGTATTGIVFGDGSSGAQGRGQMPDGQPIFASYNVVSNRYTHTAELLQPPYEAVLQSNSWGNNLTLDYTSISQQMDNILFQNDITILQSQSNNGNQFSRPEAWAKNIISVGGISHFNTATRADDRWTSASTGPAADGRIKPDLSHFYDSIYCPSNSSNTSYQTGFGGTSAATPISAGMAGLLAQAWSGGQFYNSALGSSVFANRPKASLVKAMLVNTAYRYAIGTNTTRYKQGWGTPDLANLLNARDRCMFVNESDPIQNLQSKTYRLWVPAGEAEFRATMVYTDPAGTPGATIHRVNDLNLKVTAPNGSVYWGNNGLTTANFSTSGGSADSLNTTENVFVANPLSGVWIVEVIGANINTDARPETPGLIDADFALFVAGVQYARVLESATLARGVTQTGTVQDSSKSDNTRWSLEGPQVLNVAIGAVSIQSDVTVPGGTLSSLKIRMECRFNSALVKGTVYLAHLNELGQPLESIADVSASRDDTVVEVSAGGDLSRFIKNGQLRVVIGWKRPGSLQEPITAEVDQILLLMQP